MDLTPDRTRLPATKKNGNTTEKSSEDEPVVGKTWDVEKYLEDCASIKARMADPKFSISEQHLYIYPDCDNATNVVPRQPRQPPAPPNSRTKRKSCLLTHA